MNYCNNSIGGIMIGNKMSHVPYNILFLFYSSYSSTTFFKSLSSNQIYFQDHLYISSIDSSRILITLYRNGIPLNKAIKIQKPIYLFTFDYLYFLVLNLFNPTLLQLFSFITILKS